MASKTCPACQKVHGPRKKVCECGHDFGVKTANHPGGTYPEPGSRVLEHMKGMPEVELGTVVTEMTPTEEVKQQVSIEGLGYCIYTLIPANKIEDPTLRSLWKVARKAMQDIVVWLNQP
jgi:hypothetical protein